MSVPKTQFATPTSAGQQVYPFALPDLPFAYDALEPHFDQKTLQVHHRGHHAAYVKKLNEAVARHPELQRLTLAELLGKLDQVPAPSRTAVKNNGGGHLNHDLFWSVLAPAPARPPAGELSDAIRKQFGSIDEFRRQFSDLAEKHFASGWVALAVDHGSRKLEIVDLKDHEVVTPGARTALLILDVWEHAYYLKYQNRRPEFIDAFWNIVNWAHAGELFARAGAR
jgi:Fe-Mn family superoxide dismutase